MATVTSFEAIKYPTRSELRQFAELFLPLYQKSGFEARKQAAAALSQCATLPNSICYFIGCQPIAIAAPFLTSSVAISDETLIAIARTQGADHAKAIAKRDDLSPKLIDALAAIHNGSGFKSRSEPIWIEIAAETDGTGIDDNSIIDGLVEAYGGIEAANRLNTLWIEIEADLGPNAISDDTPMDLIENTDATQTSSAPAESLWFEIPAETGAHAIGDWQQMRKMEAENQREAARLGREEALRQDLKELVLSGRTTPAPAILKGPTSLQEALLFRFARRRQAGFFAAALAETINASHALSERIMLDLSGRQLATALLALGLPVTDIRTMLCSFYPHLMQASDGRTRAQNLILSLDVGECALRLAAWRRADHYTNTGEMDYMAEAANEDEAAATNPFDRSQHKTAS